jgi:hypothetical protein
MTGVIMQILLYTPDNPLKENQYKQYKREINTWKKDSRYIGCRALDDILYNVYEEGKFYGIVICENDIIKGVITYQYKDDQFIHILHLASCGGYGKLLMKEICNEAVNNNRGIYLESAPKAVNFYTKLKMKWKEIDCFDIFYFTKQQAMAFINS